MSSYEYIDEDRDSIRIEGLAAHGDTYVTICALNGGVWSARIDNADAPTVAAELLKAAGRTDLAGYIEAVVAREAMDAREAAEKAEAEAAEKKLQERRDALAKKYHGRHFVLVGEGGQRVINDIIELQDKLVGASRD